MQIPTKIRLKKCSFDKATETFFTVFLKRNYFTSTFSVVYLSYWRGYTCGSKVNTLLNTHKRKEKKKENVIEYMTMYITRRVQLYFIFDGKSNSSWKYTFPVPGFLILWGCISKTVELTIQKESIVTFVSSCRFIIFYFIFLGIGEKHFILLLPIFGTRKRRIKDISWKLWKILTNISWKY